MAITASAASQAANSASPIFAFGFTAEAGDLIVIAVGEDGAGTCTWPDPWVELKDQTFSGAAAYVAYLVASGGETSVQPTGTVSDRWEGVIWRIPAGEWHGTSAPEINTGVSGSSTAPNPGSITPSWGSETNNIFIALAFRDDSVANTITAYPANYTTAQLDTNAVSSAANCGGAVRIVTGSPEDPGAFTISASETWIAYTIAVRPAGQGGGSVTGTAASAFGWATAASGSETITGTAASGFGFATAASGTETFSGTGGSAFGWATAASGDVTEAGSSVTGTGASSFGWAVSGSGTESIAGTGGSAFGFASAASGSESISGQAASAFSFATSGSGTATSVDSVPGTATASVSYWMVAIATVERSHTATATVS